MHPEQIICESLVLFPAFQVKPCYVGAGVRIELDEALYPELAHPCRQVVQRRQTEGFLLVRLQQNKHSLRPPRAT